MSLTILATTKEELDVYIKSLWQDELDRRIEANGVLKELREIHKQKELSNEQD